MALEEEDLEKIYYDIEESGLEYIENEKNLNKIRNQSLRRFLMFYQTIDLYLMLMIRTGKEIDKPFSYEGAKYILSSEKRKEIAEMVGKLDPKIRDSLKLNKNDIEFSKRTVYDYMNAMKYIKAIHKARSDLSLF
jgi:gas vesicle protein